jgi:hypothetical protein
VTQRTSPARPQKAREIEVRYATLDGGVTEFDEIVASNAGVHLEKMNDSQFCLIIETAHERACFFIGAKRAPVDAFESWRDTDINRRSEAQKRRWNRLTPEQRKRAKYPRSRGWK